MLGILGVSLILAPVADASAPSFVWTGDSAGAHWSAESNWEGMMEPSITEPVTLEFPHLSGCSTCYKSENDLSGLTAESIKLDNGDEYVLKGKEITLGRGGLTASPASGTSGASGDVLDLPIELTGASQTWSVAGRSGGGLGENGLAVLNRVSGSNSNALSLEISNEAEAILENETEVGPVAINGADTNEAGVFNGFVAFFGELNFSNNNPVNLNHIFFIGSGAVGVLSTNNAELDVGSGLDPAEGIVADSATFDGGSEIGFQITGEGMTAGEDYSQLASAGPVELGGSTLLVHGTPPSPSSKVCPSPHPGQKYTFISTTGALSGTFTNAPEGGPEIPIKFAAECSHPSQTMQIAYNRSGGTETVTGTVEEARAKREAKERQEIKERQEAKEQQEAKELQEARERQEAREQREAKERQETNEKQQIKEAEVRKSQEAAVAAAKRHQEEEAEISHKHEEEAAAKKNNEEESAPTGGVLLNGPSLTAQSSGETVIRLACAGTARCGGKLTLTVKSVAKKGKKAKTEVIGTASFSIPPNETTSIRVALNATGKALLSTDNGRLEATLTILKSSPSPSQTQTGSVRIVQQKAHGKVKKP